jgi:hypothetical protein
METNSGASRFKSYTWTNLRLLWAKNALCFHVGRYVFEFAWGGTKYPYKTLGFMVFRV